MLFYVFSFSLLASVFIYMGKKLGCFNLSFPKVSCLKYRKEGKGSDLVVEDVYEGQDVWDSTSVPEHLVVMVNGLVGSAEDWKFAADQFVKKLPDKVVVHCSQCNHAKLTFDGVDKMGDRLAEEVKSVVKHRHGVQKISFVAHSLGGLIARYAIGKLYVPPTDEKPPAANGECPTGSLSVNCVENYQGGTIAGLEPMNFITVATPHLGSRGNKQLPFLCGFLFLEKTASETAHLIVGRTGKHLFLTDNDDGMPPLLLRMVNDGDIKFTTALRSFKRRVAYANAAFDHMVGWRTSSIRRQDELPKFDHHVKNDKYPHIVHVEVDKMENNQVRKYSPVNGQQTDLEEEMIRGLKQVAWERVDVSFHRSRQRYIAHNTIQVKNYWMHSDGANVVYHMIDNFLI